MTDTNHLHLQNLIDSRNALVQEVDECREAAARLVAEIETIDRQIDRIDSMRDTPEP